MRNTGKRISFTAIALLGLTLWGNTCFAYPCPDIAGEDGIVNFIDFNAFSSNWRQTGIGLAGDFDYSQTVDIEDLAYLVSFWLTDGDCDQYSSDPLPYLTSFEWYQQFYSYYDLDHQNGWQVDFGLAYIEEAENYNWVYIDINTTVSKVFDSDGEDDRYIRFQVLAESTAEIAILSDSNVMAAVRFNSNGYIDVLDNGSYVGTSQAWNYNWNEVQFVMNYDTDRYDVLWNATTIKSSARFNRNYNTLDEIEIRNGSIDWFGLDRISISDESGSGGQINTDIYITTPCACETDELDGRVTVTGKMWWDRLGVYEIRYCSADPAVDPYDINNWHVAHVGWNVVDAGGILGYWDTTSIPNGYYYLGIVAYNDLGYAENGLQVLTTELRYPDGTLVYSGWKYFSITSFLKSNTFYQEESPDISVPWPGQFPFELKRIYNNNRRYYTKPLRNGWTHNNQIKLYEDSTYNWQKINSGFWAGYPAYDDDLVAYGYIWVTYPDGSVKMFRHTSSSLGESNPEYYPYPNDNSGEYIVRTSNVDDYYDWVIEYLTYRLYKRDGSILTFDTDYLGIPFDPYSYYGNLFGAVTAPIRSMADRFGNTLSFNWDYDNIAVTSVSDGTRTIEFDMTDGYYTQARLVKDSQVLMTVNYNWDSVNKIYTVTKTGFGVDSEGVYNGSTPKEYEINYQYDNDWNLRKIIYDINLINPSIEISYGDYGRVWQRRDYVEPGNYLLTAYDYNFYHPDPNNEQWSYLKTTAATVNRTITTLQDDKGRLLEVKTETDDGSAASDVNAFYNDGQNPLKPTDTYEYFDGFVRRTWNDYSYSGDLIEQQIWVDDVNFVATQLQYHPSFPLETSRLSWQDVNKAGPRVEKLSIYGNADGSEYTYGKYLVKERILLEQDPNVWAETRYVYNANGLVTKKTDPNSFVTIYEYDPNNYIKRIKIGVSDTNNSPTQRFHNDALGNRRIEAGYLGGVTLNDYDGFGRLWKVRKYKDSGVMALSDAAFVPSRYEGMTPISTVIYGYDEKGNRTFQQLEAGGVVRTQYTTNDLEKKTAFDDGSYVQNYYDGRGLKLYEYRYDANTARDWWVGYWFDDMDRPVQTVWFDYDDVNIVKAEISDYWGSGKKKTQNIYGYGFTLEKQTEYHYDVLGRLVNYIVSPGTLNLTTGYGYDAAGNRISVTDPNGNTIYYEYDNANRRIAEYFAIRPGTDPNDAIMKKEITYYENGLVREVNSYDYNDALLARSKYEYDVRRRLTKVTQDINEMQQAVTRYDYSDTGFVYDGNTYQIRVTDAENKLTHIKLDEFANRVRTLYPSGDYQWLEYNPDGTIKRKAVWDANDVNHWITYSYDGYARLKDVVYPDNGAVHYNYDGFGRKLRTTDDRNSDDRIGGTNTIVYDYDVSSRLSQTTEQDGYVIAYAYQADGQKRGIKVYEPNDAQIYDIEYFYDGTGRLQTVTEPIVGIFNSWIAQFGYDKNGNRSSLGYFKTGNPMGSTIETSYTYNACSCACDNMLTGYVTTGGPTFTFDASNPGDIDGLGRLRHNTETITKPDGNTVDHEYFYNYDMLSRLRYAYQENVPPTPAREYAYDFDRAGNMTHFMFNNYNPDEEGHTWYSYTGDMRTGYEQDVGWTGEAYFDKNGRQTSLLETNPIAYPIEYDWEGRVRKNQYSNYTLGIEANYTPEGVRVYKKTSFFYGERYAHKYIMDTSGQIPNILLVIDANDANRPIVKTYVHANNEILAQHDGSYNAPRYFYLHDRLGSVRQIVDINGSVKNSYFYTPYGATTGTETRENVKNWFTWTGYYKEYELDGYYLNARNYSGGRFMTRDPVAGAFSEPMSLHVYLYCNNDPLNKIDPKGEMAYWGAIERARGLVGAINVYGFLLNVSIALSSNPSQLLSNLENINALRENIFTDFFEKGHSQIFVEASYFNWNEDNLILALLKPGDEMDYKQYELNSRVGEGFYRHCVASCRLNRILKDAFSPGNALAPTITTIAALTFGGDWTGEDENTLWDRRANQIGIMISYNPFTACNKGCGDALIKLAAENPK